MAKKKPKPPEKKQDRPALFSPIGTVLASDEHWDSWTIPTRIPPLDHILGGGFACRRIAEIFGPPGCGKSAIGYLMAALVQRIGGISVLVDSEGAFNREFYASLGGDPKHLNIAGEMDADTVEMVYEFFVNNCKAYSEYGLDVPPMFMLWDSIAATPTKHLSETTLGKKDLSKSTAMSAGLQKLMPFVRSSNVCILGINQTYQMIGTYVPTETTPGGDRWKFLSSQRVSMRYKPSDMLKDEDNNHIGQKVTATVVKSRMGNPNQRCSLYFYTVTGAPHPTYKRETKFGFDFEESLFDYYTEGYFFLDDVKKERPLKVHDSGWYTLHTSIETTEKKFRRADWLEKLEQYPQLKTLLYNDMDIDTESLV